MPTAPRLIPAGCALALLLCSPGPALGQQGATSAPQALLEVTASRTEFFVGQPIQIELAFGLEQEFLEGAAVQPFGAALDLPVQLHAAWLDGLPGATRVTPDTEATGAGPSFALNGELRHARRLPDRIIEGRAFQMHAFDARFVAAAAGELRVPAARLSFAYATRFEDTLLDERSPLDRVDASVLGAELVLGVRALPEAGRPFEFSGAVGDLSLTASAEPREVVLGGSLRLRLELAGDVDFTHFEAPRWRELGGFRVLGVLEEHAPGALILTLDLAPVSEQVWQVPAVPIAYFDPGPPAGYRVARTEPVEVRVLPAPIRAGDAVAPAVERSAPGPAPADASSGGLLLGLLAAAVLLLGGLLVARRGR